MARYIKIGVALAAAVLASTLPKTAGIGHAETQDQQFLNLVHSNGVGGQDDTLIAYAHEFCDINDVSIARDGQGRARPLLCSAAPKLTGRRNARLRQLTITDAMQNRRRQLHGQT